MKLMVVEHVLGSVLHPTHSGLLQGLRPLLPEKGLVWYASELDFSKVGAAVGGVDLRDVPAEVSEHMGALVVWQALTHRPDAVLFVDGHTYLEGAKKLRELGFPVYMWSVDDPHELSKSSVFGKECTAVFTTEPAALPRFDRGYLLPHAACKEDSVAVREAAALSRHPRPDAVFAGSPYKNRVKWLNELAEILIEHSGLDVRCAIPRVHYLYDELHTYWKNRNMEYVNWNDLQMLYALSKATINIHRDPDTSPIAHNDGVEFAAGLNQAMFTVPAVGGRLICDSKRAAGIRAVFGDTVDLADSPEQMADMILSGGADLAKATAAGEIVLHEHTWDLRAQQLLSVIQEDLR